MTSILPNIDDLCWKPNDSGFDEVCHHQSNTVPLLSMFDLPQTMTRDAFSLCDMTSSKGHQEKYNLRDEFDSIWGEIIEPTPFREGTSLEVSSHSFSKIPNKDPTFIPLTLGTTSWELENPSDFEDHAPSRKRGRKTSSSPSKRARITESDESSEDTNSTPQFRDYQDAQWQEQFEALLNYKKQYGNCNVPHTFKADPGLSRWVKRQRYQYRLKMEGKRTSMSEERFQKLEGEKFVWDPHTALWEARCEELLEYKQTFGNCDVPCRYAKNPQLGMWVRSMRREYKVLCDGKPSRMTPERFEILDQIGFVWDPRAARTNEAE